MNNCTWWKHVLSLIFGMKCWIWCTEANVWYHVLNNKRFSQCLLFNVSFLLPSSQQGFYSQEYTDVHCQHFDSTLWRRAMIFFLKQGTSEWAETLFYISVLCGLKAKMAQHKLSSHIDRMALKYCVFETATFHFREQQLHRQTWKSLELHYSSAAFIIM